ncbi:Rpn family recombination-promoting nuclease/putative transposase [Desulfatirhabdium butyrativorans]|uniref:Rpn family recombination-promoting nuclease/putative transposase n=1 Tax=Desulfatirhabdium butyrativorans TaxID=340467 RepID=UPI000401E6AA|nr:Rpn family recombination-promoting nuclease/putative transposase [Desulfatirhabdium butyrativorans]
MEMPNPHDRLFKAVWNDRSTARSFFQHYLPCDLLRLIDLDALQLCTESFIEEELREYRCDLLYQTTINGRPGYLYFLFEHKSHADPDVALQLLGYMRAIWHLYRKQEAGGAKAPLPVIVPLVLYHGRNAWTCGDDLLSRFEQPATFLLRYIPNFQFVLIDLSRFSDAEIQGEALLRASLLLFKYVFTPEYRDRLPGIFALLKSLVESTTGMQYIETIIRYVLSTLEDAGGTGTLKKVVEESLSEDKGDMVMTIAEKLYNEGLERGIQQGRQQGIQQGLLNAIELGLEIKFGAQASYLLAAIRQVTDIDRLKAIREAIRIGASLKDIEEMIIAHQA